ncbi:MAG: tRNA-dihydrouridine synthase family protein [Desulfovibrio sp.]|nr:tRNA-dihydrouridine synthase family protein [Desulfovibrio sp.]
MPKAIIPEAQASPTQLPFDPLHPWLAPLAGISDLPFRLLCRSYGCACACTEMISAKGLRFGSRGTYPLLNSTQEDTPLVVQLFGSGPEDLDYATQLLLDHGYRWFDLNVGCAVPKVLRQGAGAGMLADIPNLLRTAERMIHIAEPNHVGFKLRLGLEATSNRMPNLPIDLAALGAGWITLHPRYAKQKFTGTADWSQIALLTTKLNIPVVASGDLFTAKNGLDCLAQTHATTVMYARGAIRNPAIFAEHNALLNQQNYTQSPIALKKMLLRFLDLVAANTERDQTTRMRGILASFVRGLPNAKNLRLQLVQCQHYQDLYAVLNQGIDTNSVQLKN